VQSLLDSAGLTALGALGLLAAAPLPGPVRPSVLVAVPSPRVTIPAGRFPMGATPEDVKAARELCAEELRAGGALMADLPPRCGARFEVETPEAEVFLPTYTIDRHEVTVGEYAACVRKRACPPAIELPLDGDPRLPVERVTWDEAAAFCRARGGRLPTEAEWEKAARGPTRRTWPWGSQWLEARANHGRAERLGPGQAGEETVDDADGFTGRAPVGTFSAGASPYGLLDVAGNVWEWTSGAFSREPPQGTVQLAPLGPAHGAERTVRGGSYRSPASDLRTTRRLGLAPHERQAGVGFRCVYR
jgi:formylglycine-generating enzyme required for sulfatase activity